jgi:hypothetical protein
MFTFSALLLACDGATPPVETDPSLCTWFQDLDGDGWGNPDVTHISRCGTEAPAGFVEVDGDCADSLPMVNPGGTEVLDGWVDQDCNGVADDCDQEWAPAFGDLDGDGAYALRGWRCGSDGAAPSADDCDDGDPEVGWDRDCVAFEAVVTRRPWDRVVVADVIGDASNDIVVLSQYSNLGGARSYQGELRIWEGPIYMGQGVPVSPYHRITTTADPKPETILFGDDLIVADFLETGHDAIINNTKNGTILIHGFRPNADEVEVQAGTDQAVVMELGPWGRHIAATIGDINGDPYDNDLWMVSAGASWLFEFAGGAHTEQARVVPTEGHHAAVRFVGDADGDGLSDVVVAEGVAPSQKNGWAGDWSSADVSWVASPTGEVQAAAYADQSVVLSAGAPLPSGDPNGDGYADLMLFDADLSYVSVFEGSTDPQVGSPVAVIQVEGQGRGAVLIDVGDLDGDGRDDLSSAAEDLYGPLQGDLALTLPEQIAPPALGDVNLDGIPDRVTSTERGEGRGTIALLRVFVGSSGV